MKASTGQPPVDLGKIQFDANGNVIGADQTTELFVVPAANAVFAEDRVLQFKHSDVGVAVAIEGGLFTREDLARWQLNFEEPRVGGAALVEAMDRSATLRALLLRFVARLPVRRFFGGAAAMQAVSGAAAAAGGVAAALSSFAVALLVCSAGFLVLRQWVTGRPRSR